MVGTETHVSLNGAAFVGSVGELEKELVKTGEFLPENSV